MLVCVQKSVTSEFNGTSKDYQSRNLIINKISKKIDIKTYTISSKDYHISSIIEILENLPNVDKILFIDYLRIPVSKKIKQKYRVKKLIYRAHHFETLHFLENLFCQIVLSLRVRKRIFSIRSNLFSFLKFFYRELRCMNEADYILNVSKSDTTLMNYFFNKNIYFPFATSFKHELCKMHFGLFNENKIKILYLGSIVPAPNILHSFHLFSMFHSKLKKYKEKLLFVTTGELPKFSTKKRKRAKDLQNLFDEFHTSNFLEDIYDSHYIFIGSLYGRGIKTKIYDMLYLKKRLIIHNKFIPRILQYEINLSIKKIGEYSIIRSKNDIEQLMINFIRSNEKKLMEIL